MGVVCFRCHRNQVLYPLVVTDLLEKYDVKASVRGGGLTGELNGAAGSWERSSKRLNLFFLRHRTSRSCETRPEQSSGCLPRSPLLHLGKRCVLCVTLLTGVVAASLFLFTNRGPPSERSQDGGEEEAWTVKSPQEVCLVCSWSKDKELPSYTYPFSSFCAGSRDSRNIPVYICVLLSSIYMYMCVDLYQ